ncbi:T9SS type A sorting domain-containing protein [Chryseobacterium bernardetii]|uniref:T9SS type A sorting domain-containing protein n=1 Tax=Chryseobacterium bernardetii TaxID=1241978 RepID=UPI00162A8C41|nr:T9SS type A sorting domain-containing protein [Chryseobacterium bernardetii]
MKTNLLSGRFLGKTILLLLLFFVLNSFAYAQKVYAGTQHSQIYGLCMACSILDAQNTLGDNEDDYSSMVIPIGAIARIEQTLIFPAVTKQEKIVIGIGTGQGSLSVQLLSGVSIETFNGNISNNDYQIVNNEILKLGISNPTRGTVELFVSKPFDRVRVTLNSGLLNLNGGLRIYYAYHRPHGCTYPPFEPLHYYSFNGNLNDAVNGYEMTSSLPPDYQNNMRCGQGLGTTTDKAQYSLTGEIKKLNGKTSRDLALNHSISFWAKIGPKQPGNKSPSLAVEPILDRFVILPDSLKLEISSAYPSFGLGNNTQFGWAPNTSDSFDHFLVRNKDGLVEVFKNGKLVFNGGANFYFDLSPFETIINLVGNDISNIVTLDRTQIDELIVYDKALTSEEITMLYDSYNWKVSGLSRGSGKASKTEFKEDRILQISPNPTEGHISLDGNMDLKNAKAFIINSVGKEVYHTTLRSKSFNIPVDLSAGVYILHIETKDKKVYDRKIILKR